MLVPRVSNLVMLIAKKNQAPEKSGVFYKNPDFSGAPDFSEIFGAPEENSLVLRIFLPKKLIVLSNLYTNAGLEIEVLHFSTNFPVCQNYLKMKKFSQKNCHNFLKKFEIFEQKIKKIRPKIQKSSKFALLWSSGDPELRSSEGPDLGVNPELRISELRSTTLVRDLPQ